MTQTPPSVDLLEIDLGVTGMTCTSCSSRVERKLNKLDGVDASVNFSTETATVKYEAGTTDTDQLIEVVRGAGYDAFALRSDADSGGDESGDSTGGAVGPQDQIGAAREREAADLKQRVIGSAILTVPITGLSMVPALQFTNWQWAVLAMTTLVYVWGGAPFHRATFVNLRHGAVMMDTLITMGTTAAYAWSLWALFVERRCRRDDDGRCICCSMTPRWMRSIWRRRLMVITFLLLGRSVRDEGQGELVGSAAHPAGHGRQGRRCAP